MEIVDTLVNLIVNLWTLVVELLALGIHWFALVAWVAWWLWGVNWKKVWPVLAGGGWAPLVLMMLLGALAWSRLDPAECNCLGFPMANFWWQLLGVTGLTGLAFFCGWLQGVFGWAPEEIDLEPPLPASQGHGHH